MGRMKPTVIGFSGRIKSGKTTVSQAVAEALSVKHASFGDFVRSIAVRRGLDPECRKVLQELGESLIAEGWIKFCQDVLRVANWNQGEALVVDGIRHVQAVTELTALTAPLPFNLVHVHIDEEVRQQRIGANSEVENQSRESHSTERDARDALPSQANLVVDGSKPLNDIVDEIVEFLSQS